MGADEWEEIKRIFESALDQSSSQRAAFLDAACGNRSALRETVNELLSAHGEATGFLDDSASRVFSAVFHPGQLVAERFRIVRLISRGGMGEVYETFDERLSIRLALKTLRPEFASDADALERFRREIRVTRDFAHANLCRVYELVEHRPAQGDPQSESQVVTCLTMQLMSGETLKQYLEKKGPLSPEVALPLIKQIAGAISTLHDNGIIHRDLKPSNIMIAPAADSSPRAIVMDFGLAKPLTADEVFESASDFQAGAPFFLAPELVAGEKPSVASDIYALGLIIDEMVTTGGAFTGQTVEAILYQKLWGQPKDAQSRAPGLPTNWAATIHRCLDRDPAERFASSQDVVAGLITSALETQSLPPLYKAQIALTRMAPKLDPPASVFRTRNLVLGFGALLAAGMVLLALSGSRPIDMSVLTFDFENLTGRDDYDYICKGMTLEVERRLLTIPGVKVIPFHGPHPKDASIRSDAQFTIEGQLEASQKSPRLSISVVEKSTGMLICCANTFENSLADPLEMQSQISSAAVDAMRAAVLRPSSGESHGLLPAAALFLWRNSPFNLGRVVAAAPTVSPAAMQTYMRAHALQDQRTLSSLRQAAGLYQKATEEDPKFALAYSGWAGVDRAMLEFNVAPADQLLRSARAHALQAIAAAPEYAESYAELAVVEQNSWDWQGAEQNFKRALELNPKLAYVHRWFGGFLIQFGRFDEGIKEVRVAIALDPYDQGSRLFLGTYLLYAGRLTEAATVVEGFLAEQDFMFGHTILSYVYAQRALRAKGAERTELFDRALKEAGVVAKEDATYQKPDYAGASIPIYALIYALRGDKPQAQRYLQVLLQGEKSGAVGTIDIATPYVALGDTRSALAVLKRGVDAKDNALLYLKVDPFLNPLRNNPEFKALLSQAGLN